MPTKKEKTTKSSTTKRTAKKAVEETPIITENSKASDEGLFDPIINKLKINKRFSLIALFAIVLIIALYSFRSLFVVAMVNGQPISRLEVIKELEKQSGKQVIDSLVTEALVLQEAKKQNVNISQSEIDAEIKKIEDNLKQQGQTLDQVLALRGMTKKDVQDQIKLQKIVEKLAAKDVKVTDQEVNDYIEKNKSSFPEGTNPEEMKDTVKQQLLQQKTNDKVQSWISSLQSKAKINYFVTY